MAATAGVSPCHLLLEVEVEEMHEQYVCSVIVPGVVGEGGISLYTVCTYLVVISLAAATVSHRYIQPFRLMLAN